MIERNPHVTRLLDELREFSFEDNIDFKNNLFDGYEVTKHYFHTDPRLLSTRSIDDDRDVQTTEFTFSAFRRSERTNGRSSYLYIMGATVTRSLDQLEPYIAAQLEESTRKELDDFEPDDLTESFYMEFTADDSKPNRIKTKQSYAVEQYGETVHDTNEDDFALSHTNNFVQATDPNKKRKTKKIFIPATIDAEQYPLELPRLLNDAAFEAIVGPLSKKSSHQTLPTEEAARRMSAMLQKMRTGRIE